MTTLLPISSFKSQILDSVSNNSVVIITAETGAGKSTQVPQFLVNSGYRVVVTQPRRLAATSVAERVAEEMGCKLGTFIGYRTGEESCCSNGTRGLFVTDGLQLVRELTSGGQTDVLIIDEVHEWNLNIEVLVAWCRHQQQLGSPLKVVLMSATMEAEKLAEYFGNAPIISVPGRTFPVEEKQDTSDSVVANVKALVAENRNILVFQPGKAEIEECIYEISQEIGEKAVLLPLHGNLTSEEQHKVFQNYNLPKVVVATNVAQTSITIPDIDAVIDTGVERRIELSDGIEGLYLKEISRADCMQRKGRAGRTKEGIYILCSETSLEDRNEFPRSEIERSRLDQMVLRLAVAGFDASELDFFHDPGHTIILEAKRTLQVLGALDHDGEVTQIGRQMSHLPLSVQFSRMVVEAARYGVLDEVITVAAILEVGGITARDGRWGKLTKEHDSDLLAQLDVYQKACELHKSELHESGIWVKNFYRVKELRRKLWKSVKGLKSTPPIVDEASSRDMIKKACLAGMVDHVYQSRGRRLYSNGDYVMRQIARESVVVGDEIVVGLPLDIQIRSGRTLNLIQMVTKVDLETLKEVAPQLFEFDENYTQYDVRNDVVKSQGSVKFNGQVIQSNISQPCADKAKATEVLAEYLACQTTR